MVRNREKRKNLIKLLLKRRSSFPSTASRLGYLDSANAEFLNLKEVVFHACANAMRANHVSESSLPEQVIVVPAGVLDLVELQSQGYAYIKP